MRHSFFARVWRHQVGAKKGEGGMRVTDGRKKRYDIVSQCAGVNIVAGILMAAMDYEWTCRRVILALGKKSAPDIKDDFGEKMWSGQELVEAWRAEIEGEITLPLLFDQWASERLTSYVSWEDIVWAYQCRNRLVHGAWLGISRQEGGRVINILEKACDVLSAYAKENKVKLTDILRRGKRTEERKASPSKTLPGTHDGEIRLEGVRYKTDAFLAATTRNISVKKGLTAAKAIKIHDALKHYAWSNMRSFDDACDDKGGKLAVAQSVKTAGGKNRKEKNS